jgi:uncharacterized protein
MTATTRKPGDFCWINLLTPQPRQACEFFGALLGWTYADIPGMGYLVKVGGTAIGGLFDTVSPRTPNGTPPEIGVMIKVESAAAACERAKALGGKSEPPFDIMGNLVMGMVTDPNGARFDLFEPRAQQGTDVDRRVHGAPSWFETLTTDVERAGAFYTSLFGWTGEAMPIAGTTYTTFQLGSDPIAGMMGITPEMGPIPPHWGVYFTVTDVDATARDAAALGGSLFIPVMPIPNVGRFCGVISPQGVRFYAIQYAG